MPLSTAASSSVGGDSGTRAGDTGGHTEAPAQAPSSEGPVVTSFPLITDRYPCGHLFSCQVGKSDNHEEMQFGQQAKTSTMGPTVAVRQLLVAKGVPGGMRRHPRGPRQAGDGGGGSRGPVPIESWPWLGSTLVSSLVVGARNGHKMGSSKNIAVVALGLTCSAGSQHSQAGSRLGSGTLRGSLPSLMPEVRAKLPRHGPAGTQGRSHSLQWPY